MKFTSALFAAAAVCGATSANAAVRYEFITTAPPGTYPNHESYGSFTVTTSNYIASYGGLNPATFDSCSVTQPVSYTCAIVYFNPTTGPGGAYSTIQFVSESPSGDWYSSQFLFAGAALSNPGAYISVSNSPFSTAVIATLRVSEVAAAAVPEPATWALMLAGFGMAGFGLRRRGAVRAAASLA